MNDRTKETIGPGEAGEAVLKKHKRFSVVWIIPVIAAAIGGWLWYRSIAEAGLPITLHFQDGSGIHAGKTDIKFGGVSVGVVDSVELRDDFGGVVVRATLDRSAGGLAREGSVFWLVKPRVDFGGISGLDTLVSGDYITVRPGGGPQRAEFSALPKPPTVRFGASGLHVFVTARTLGSLMPGTPVYFRRIRVGSVQDHALSEEGKTVRVRVHIEEQFASLVGENTRFWNASGIHVEAGFSGVKVRTESVAALLTGGLAFDTPEDQDCGKPSRNGDEYALYPDYDSAMESGLAITMTFGSGHGIKPGMAIKYRELVVGKVKKVVLGDTGDLVLVEAVLEGSAKDVAREGSQFWVVKPHLGFDAIYGLDTLISGRYITVRAGTGLRRTEFRGLDAPPRRDPTSPGLHIVLKCDTLGSFEFGSPVYYKKVPVGEIDGYELDEDKSSVRIHTHIRAKFAHLVRKSSRFYNVSGMKVEAGIGGVRIATESIVALLGGGVSFVTPGEEAGAAASKSGDVFELYKDYKAATEKGTRLTIQFASGRGLRKGAAIKYQGIKVGEVKSVGLEKAMGGVTVQAVLEAEASYLAREGTVFWVVKPHVNLGGISGIETLLTGQYIEVRPGHGKPRSGFIGAEDTPLRDPESPGLHIGVTADKLGSLAPGAPIYYRSIQVGEVQGHELLADGRGVKIHLYIQEQNAALVRKKSRFYNASGICIDASLSGVKVRTESIQALLAGGVAFVTPDSGDPGVPSEDGDSFPLYADHRSAEEGGEKGRMLIKIAFKTGQGLRVGRTEIKCRGMTVGKVTGVELGGDMRGVAVTAWLDSSAEALAREGAQYWLVKPAVGLQGVRGLETIVTGAYIQAKTGEGARTTSFVALDQVPVEEVAPEVPSLRIVLRADRLGSLKPGSPVYYRQIEVGQVEAHRLAPNGNGVLIHVRIGHEYAPLVRKDSVFWNASGIGMELGLTGAKIRTESMAAILGGGVAFATPDGRSPWLLRFGEKVAPRASDGAVFKLHRTLEKKWLKWHPRIPLDLKQSP